MCGYVSIADTWSYYTLTTDDIQPAGVMYQ